MDDRPADQVLFYPTVMQLAFLRRPEREVLLHSLRGGGKTTALVAAAVEHAHRPDYRGLLLARTHWAAHGHPWGLFHLAASRLSYVAGLVADRPALELRFPAGGTLRVDCFDDQADTRAVLRHAGAEYGFIGVDGAHDLAEHDYRYLLSRLRASASSPTPTIRLAADDDRIAGRHWLRAYFLDGCPLSPSYAGRAAVGWEPEV